MTPDTLEIDNTPGAYCFVEKETEKIIYIGETNSLKTRYETHMRDLANDCHHNEILQTYYNNGVSMDFVVLQKVEDWRETQGLENYWRNKLRFEYIKNSKEFTDSRKYKRKYIPSSRQIRQKETRMKKITRKRALEIAQEAIKHDMLIYYPKVHTDEIAASIYAELAAALAYIENLQRQKELL